MELDFSKLENIAYRGFEGEKARAEKDKLIEQGFTVIEGATTPFDAPPAREADTPTPPLKSPVQRQLEPFTGMDKSRNYRAMYRAACNFHERAVSALKGYAVRHNTLVFVIMAHNRTSNSKGIVTMESGRDTSALEYSADLQLALAYTACLKRNGQDKKDPEDLTGEERQRLTLVILKGRFGGVGREVDLQFDGETMTYKQMAQGFSDPQAIQKPRLRF